MHSTATQIDEFVFGPWMESIPGLLTSEVEDTAKLSPRSREWLIALLGLLVNRAPIDVTACVHVDNDGIKALRMQPVAHGDSNAALVAGGEQ